MNFKENENYYTGELFRDLEQDVYVIPQATNQRTKSQTPHFMFVTIMIIAANVIAGLLAINMDNRFEAGGVNYEHIIRNKEYGRLLSYMFLHVNFEHLLSNMVGMWIIGSEVEKKLGSLRTAIIYFGSGIGGGFISMMVSHMLHPDRMRFAAGASAAVFGMTCAMVFLTVKGEKKAEQKHVLTALVLVVIFALLSRDGNVDIYGHIGGAIIGGILTFVVNIKKWENFEEKTYEKLIGIIVTLALCIAGIGEANIGKEVPSLPDERVDFMKEQQIFQNETANFGEVLDAYCISAGWSAFTSTQKEDIVEFNGEAYYLGVRRKIHIQFIVNMIDRDYSVCYFAFDDEAQNGTVLNEFFRHACAEYQSIKEQ
ncbi:MAG: rhomboid family intramembrane serine protease [Eubacteriales bacterium]|nr:rhomboid family intramembrane serine protease [Lachnospiraceae bacterium]MDO5127272.1 rhomboid family intramembrane serine protease [Eubacteriales bacterium]